MSDYQNQETASWDSRQVRSSSGERQRPPERRRRRRRRRVNPFLYILFVLVVSAVLAGVGWLLINDFCAFNKPYVEPTVEVTAEDDLSSVAEKLQDAQLIQYKWFFKLFGKMNKAESKIGVGTYQLNSNMDYLALITAMHNSSGSLNSETVRVTIPEGYTVAQTISLLAQKGVNTEAALTEAAQSYAFSYDFIDNSSSDISRLEGYLFPDTYDFYVGEKASSALNRLLYNFSAKMDEDRMELVEVSGRSLKEIMTIASLIEKETDGSDQANIASVIYNRLSDTGSHGTYQMLNIDAALLYALPDHTGAITNEDKQTDSPYNLYKYAGLPPTPIANPGIAAIDAALQPASTDYYYYALGKDGKHHYSTTLQEHNSFLSSESYAGN
jgi:UPF0755 protein